MPLQGPLWVLGEGVGFNQTASFPTSILLNVAPVKHWSYNVYQAFIPYTKTFQFIYVRLDTEEKRKNGTVNQLITF